MTRLQTNVIDTEGVTIEDIPSAERPAYSIAAAIAWAKRPENAPRIEQVAQRAGEVQRNIARRVDDEVTKVGRLLVDMATNDDVLEDVTVSLLRSLVGDD